MGKLPDLVPLKSEKLSDLVFGHLSHDQIAHLIKHLYPHHLEFRDVCKGASERIKWLEYRVNELEAKLDLIHKPEFKKIGSNLKSQDSECTANPMFVVEESQVLSGFDAEYCERDQIVWMCDGESCYFAGNNYFEELEAEFEQSGVVRDGHTRTGFIRSWKFVQPFFTKAAADNFIARHGGKFEGELRLNIDSAYRNEEWQQIRKLLVSFLDSGEVGE